MVSVGVREFKARLSEYLRIVKQGGVVEITDRGRPVGRLGPALDSAESGMRQLAADGLIAWSGKKPVPRRPTWGAQPPPSVSDLLIGERDEGVERLLPRD